MTRYSCVVVRPLSVLAACAALLLVTGCAPRNIYWMDADAEVGPQVPQPTPTVGPRGYLSVATQHFGEPGDEEPEKYPPVFLYDRSGHWLEELSNNTDRPLALAPGEYILLVGESLDPMGEFRQVQLRIDDGRTTRVNQADIDHAPELWALSRTLSQ